MTGARTLAAWWQRLTLPARAYIAEQSRASVIPPLPPEGDDKELSTLRAQCALQGVEFYLIGDRYLTRWSGLTCEHNSLDAVQQWLKRAPRGPFIAEGSRT